MRSRCGTPALLVGDIFSIQDQLDGLFQKSFSLLSSGFILRGCAIQA